MKVRMLPPPTVQNAVERVPTGGRGRMTILRSSSSSTGIMSRSCDMSGTSTSGKGVVRRFICSNHAHAGKIHGLYRRRTPRGAAGDGGAHLSSHQHGGFLATRVQFLKLRILAAKRQNTSRARDKKPALSCGHLFHERTLASNSWRSSIASRWSGSSSMRRAGIRKNSAEKIRISATLLQKRMLADQ
jgi:hypothetical protein